RSCGGFRGVKTNERSHVAAPTVQKLALWSFNEFELPFFCAMQNVEGASLVAENKHVAIAEFTFLHRFFDRHGTQRHGLLRANQMSFRSLGCMRELVHDYGNSRRYTCAGGHLHLDLWSLALPGSFGLALGIALAAIVLQGLLLNMVQSFADRDEHIA